MTMISVLQGRRISIGAFQFQLFIQIVIISSVRVGCSLSMYFCSLLAYCYVLERFRNRVTILSTLYPHFPNFHFLFYLRRDEINLTIRI